MIFVETPSSLPILDLPSDQGLRWDDIVLKSHVTTNKTEDRALVQNASLANKINMLKLS